MCSVILRAKEGRMLCVKQISAWGDRFPGRGMSELSLRFVL